MLDIRSRTLASVCIWQYTVSVEHMPAGRPVRLIKDAADAEIVACALAGKADVFVTGDKALLDLGVVENLPIRSPRQLWRQFAGLEGTEERK